MVRPGRAPGKTAAAPVPTARCHEVDEPNQTERSANTCWHDVDRDGRLGVGCLGGSRGHADRTLTLHFTHLVVACRSRRPTTPPTPRVLEALPPLALSPLPHLARLVRGVLSDTIVLGLAAPVYSSDLDRRMRQVVNLEESASTTTFDGSAEERRCTASATRSGEWTCRSGETVAVCCRRTRELDGQAPRLGRGLASRRPGCSRSTPRRDIRRACPRRPQAHRGLAAARRCRRRVRWRSTHRSARFDGSAGP